MSLRSATVAGFLLATLFVNSHVIAQALSGSSGGSAGVPIEDRVSQARAKSGALSPRDRESVKALFSSAFQTFQAGDYRAAQIGFEDGLARDPANGTAHYYLAETLTRLKNHQSARAHYEMAAALAPSTPEGLRARAALAQPVAQPPSPPPVQQPVVAVAPSRTPETSSQGYSPQVGEAGKDVIYVPTPQEMVELMLSMAKTTERDYLIDLGSGDGRIVIAAAKKFGARALGVEYNPQLVELSRRRAQQEGVSDRATFIQGDIFQFDFRDATVLTLYLLPALNLKLRSTIQQMKPGTRIVSHAFTMGDWTPVQEVELQGRKAYMWVVSRMADSPIASVTRLPGNTRPRFAAATMPNVLAAKKTEDDLLRLIETRSR